MIVSPSAPGEGHAADRLPPEQVRALFHRLNNQLGIILAHAELLELRAPDAAHRTRASQIVTSALDAMAISRELSRQPE